MRFDELELEPAVAVEELSSGLSTDDAPRFRRLMALLTDLSLFVALALALSPLLPPNDWIAIASLAGFVLVVSYYYFAGSWMLWGKTIGGTIFDVRVVGVSLKSATMRFAGLLLSLATGGLGFAMAALPSRQSLPDRMSGTRCVRG